VRAAAEVDRRLDENAPTGSAPRPEVVGQ